MSAHDSRNNTARTKGLDYDGTRPLQSHPAGIVGVTIGVCGWGIGRLVVCALSGSWSLWRATGPIALGISAAISGALVATMELVLRRFGSGPMFQLWLWSELLLFGGLQILLLNHWLVPAILADPETTRKFQALGTPNTLDDGFTMPLLA